MPSHTFTRTGYWQESIDGNIAAAAAARREGQTAEELHASDYEIYAYLQTGQDQAARRTGFPTRDRLTLRSEGGVERSRRPGGWIFCAGGDPGTLCAGTSGLEAGRATPAAGHTVSSHGCYDVVRPRIGRGATRAGAGGERVSDSTATNSRAALEGQRKLLGAAGGNPGACGPGMGCARGGQKEEALRQMKSAAELEDGTEKSAVTPGPLARRASCWARCCWS